jgi:hypothetical protein
VQYLTQSSQPNSTLSLNGRAKERTNRSTKNRKLNGSATQRRETHVTKSTRTKTLNLNGGSKKIISNAIKRRAQAIIEDRSIDAQSRAIIRYGLETNDPWLPELVRRIEAGEPIIETIVFLKHS